MVGVAGFEPAAPASRRQCSTKLSYTPTKRYFRLVVNLKSIRTVYCEVGEGDQCVTKTVVRHYLQAFDTVLRVLFC